MSSITRIEVVIVTFNSGDLLERCLTALSAAADGEQLGVTVVDNASTISVVPCIQKSRIAAELIQLSDNYGYAAANNIGIRHVLLSRSNPDAILVLNPDVSLPPGSIKALLSVLSQFPECAAVSPRVMDLLNRDCSALRSLWGFPLRPLPSPNQQLLRTDRLPGCCMLIRPELFEHVGMFDEKYFLYWEEIDFCLRARSAGHELLINRDIAIVHRGDGIGTLKRHRVYYTWRNQVRFAFKNYGRLLGLLFLMRRLFITNLRELITYLCCGRPSLLLAGMAGLWAALVGEAGHSESCHAAPEREIA